MELKILSGNNLPDASQKAAEDDLYNECLEQFTSTNKGDNSSIVTKENALEAATLLFQKKNNIDSYDALEKAKSKFN